ncbi:ABC transporter permease [Oceanirhabdus sp. W0125-5]|uniref:ABC transporter permease n=1 Tax=Oceanirhabdus sp. W0125-5 TaxID=2999116 RepID=UPI0022F2B5D4|nr:ABC transporter permease [Oceanirhabdus sp. W0125-5]WBW96865.1 ABC transporter permease [Oceanirhabdus sp. W0125-5]
MSAYNLARSNFKNNIRAYSVHMLAMIFSIAIYYNFATLKYNPEALGSDSLHYAAAGASKAAAFLLILFLAFFVWYSNTIFLKQRKKEIGMYCFMGVTTEEIGRVYVIESISMGLTALCLGIIGGILINKLFLMALATVAIGNVKIGFFLSIESITETAGFFLLFFIAASVRGYININRSKLIQLFNASKMEDKPQKVSIIKGILSLIILGGAYYYVSYKIDPYLVAKIPIVIGLIVWGTFWLFQALIPGVIKWLQKKKNIFYRGTNIIAVSNLAFRIRKNYKSLTAVAILVASAITAFGTCYSIKYNVELTERYEAPFHLAFMSEAEKHEGITNKIKEVIKESEDNIDFSVTLDGLHIDEANVEEYKNSNTFHFSDYFSLKYSDFEKIVRAIEGEKADKILSKVVIGEDLVTLVMKPGVMASLVEENHVNSKGIHLDIEKSIYAPIFGKLANLPALVMRDEDYEKYKELFKEYRYTGLNIEDREKLKDITNGITHKFKESKEEVAALSQESLDKNRFKELEVYFFLGGVLALVFIVASGVMVYFNIITEAYMDKEKYIRLMNIGVTKNEIWSTAIKQGAIQCILPLVAGSIHAIVALRVLALIMTKNLIIPASISIVFLALVYMLFYLLAINKFIKVVTNKGKA